METVRSIAEVRGRVRGWHAAGERVALVPTMGALHEGHLSLVRLAQERAERTVVSIFVNPTQFAPNEDFTAYPRDETRDLDMLENLDVDAVYAPDAGEMYGDAHRTVVEVQGLGNILEGSFRPHFFAGVATVCAKLFIQVGPDVAVFGEKDYQQLCVIRTMVRDLNLPVEIVGAPTIRESDGLAMSSRNAYLSNAERALAPRLHGEIVEVAERVKKGEIIEHACADAAQQLNNAGFSSVDYITVRDAETLDTPTDGSLSRVLAAVWLGKTRLIDNIPV